MCTKVMNAEGSNFAEENWNILYVDSGYYLVMSLIGLMMS